jgi:type II secretory pathway predicted ATPase ExeA
VEEFATWQLLFWFIKVTSLNSFIQEIKIPVVLCGLPVAEHIFNWSSQMDQRLSNRLKMKPFNFETTKEQLEFKIFLKSIDDKLPFFNRSKLEEPQIALLIHNATKGIPSYINELLTIATKMSETGVIFSVKVRNGSG